MNTKVMSAATPTGKLVNMKCLAKIVVVVLGGLIALSLAGLIVFGSAGSHNTGSTLTPMPLTDTGPKPEFGDWFVFNPDEVGYFRVDANGNAIEVGGSMPFRVTDSNYLLGTVKRVPAGTPLIYALNDRLVVQLYGSSTSDCQPQIKSVAWISSQQLVVVLDDLVEDTLGCRADLRAKTFDLFPTKYPDNEFWRDPNQVAQFLAQIPDSDNVLEWKSKMDHSEAPQGIAYEFGGFTVADSISRKNGAEAGGYGGSTADLTYIETDGVDAVSDDGGHIVCRFGQPCVSVDEFGNETELVIDQGICNDDGCETPPAPE